MTEIVKLQGIGERDLNALTLRVRDAASALEKVDADVARAAEAYNEATTFGDERAAETAFKALKAQKERREKFAGLLEGAKRAHAMEVDRRAAVEEADRLGRIAAHDQSMAKAIEEAEAHISALVSVVQRVADAQKAMITLAQPKEAQPHRWRFDRINARLPQILVDRLRFLGSFDEMKVGLRWEDKAAGRIKWADVLTKPAPQTADSK